ncbi:tetratricopeptide repeat protein [Ktedonobacter sp. SOSP1-85]|uniref:tetratricopeptide repeat protein n=1 Tax=Ktedonobacter sp. SOSP1-85 TaxID=2778367 RepID=UPI001915F6E6|nr:tetratricopeptide repeat protein [Ktedonobacter sp. SOSP1-85]GHO80418.1 tetratricopeptide repeat protein [Ktedonobacter sp. SOSP1-85]
MITIQRWERGIQQPSAYYRVKLCALFGLSAQELGLVEEDISTSEPEPTEITPSEVEPVQKLALWIVPYARNPHFTGRAATLEHVHQRFAPADAEATMSLRQVALTQAQAIKGLGGIGKTQIAVEYAYRAHEQGRYTHTLWIASASEEALLSSFAAIADQVPALRATAGEIDQRKRAHACIGWLESCEEPWLLIFDNADDLTFLPAYLPQGGNGDILLTTRVHAVGALALSIELDTMGVAEGTHLLLRRAQREALAAAEEIDDATNLAIALGLFPLALDQAGAYIEETGSSVREYLQLYQHHRHALLAQRGWQITHYPDSVATTWDLAFQQVEQANPAAAELLQLCAFLAPDHIPEELLSQGAAHWPPALQQAVSNYFTFSQMLKLLLAYSLVKRFPEERLLSIHRLVQVVQVERLAGQERRQWAEGLVRALHAAFPADPTDPIASWPQCQRYLEHAQACDHLIQEYHLQFPEAAELLDRTATYLQERALYTLAEPLYQRALRLREELLGTEHPDTARTMNNLAVLYSKQGRYAEAEPLYLQAFRILEEQLGPEHVDTARTLNNLAVLYSDQGRYAEAEPLNLRAIHLLEQQFGSEHAQVAAPLNALANLYTNQGKYGEAEPLYLRSIHILEQTLGSESLQVAKSLNGLSYIYTLQEKYTQAEALYQRALHIMEQQLGLEHPRVAFPLIGLAYVNVQQGKYEQAEPLYLRALRIREQQLGPEHLDVAMALYELANLYQKQGRYAEAEPVYLRALRIREQQVGSEHLSVSDTLRGLANLYTVLEDYERAKPLYLRALSIREQHLGPESDGAAEILHDFAGFWQAQGQLQEAVTLYQRALHIREKALGTDHPMTVATHDRLQEVLLALDQVENAALQ